MLDYVFSKLGITTKSINHPIIMTETLCNPLYSRAGEHSFYASFLRLMKLNSHDGTTF